MAMKAMEMEGMNKSRHKDIYFHETEPLMNFAANPNMKKNDNYTFSLHAHEIHGWPLASLYHLAQCQKYMKLHSEYSE